MNILTDGSRFVHADVDRQSHRLRFVLPIESESAARNWWGRLESGDEVTTGGNGPRVELLDETLVSLTRDLRRRPLRVQRSGVVHLRIDGAGAVEVEVRRAAPWFTRVGGTTRRRQPEHPIWSWMSHRLCVALGFDRDRRSSRDRFRERTVA